MEEIMNVEEISVAIHLVDKPGSNLKARADVVLPVDGVIDLIGFSIIESRSGTLFVGMPSRPGSQGRYFDSVALRGKIKTLIEQAILAEYGRAVRTDNTVSFPKSDARRA
jgi:DNA-binding cell septation regulator SpoVG